MQAYRKATSKKEPRKFDREEDARNCTFSPKINRASKSMVRTSGPFIQRVEASHESKRQALETRRGKAEMML